MRLKFVSQNWHFPWGINSDPHSVAHDPQNFDGDAQRRENYLVAETARKNKHDRPPYQSSCRPQVFLRR